MATDSTCQSDLDILSWLGFSKESIHDFARQSAIGKVHTRFTVQTACNAASTYLDWPV